MKLLNNDVYFIPKINELNKSLPALAFITGSTSDEKPKASIVAATIAVAIALTPTLVVNITVTISQLHPHRTVQPSPSLIP